MKIKFFSSETKTSVITLFFILYGGIILIDNYFIYFLRIVPKGFEFFIVPPEILLIIMPIIGVIFGTMNLTLEFSVTDVIMVLINVFIIIVSKFTIPVLKELLLKT